MAVGIVFGILGLLLWGVSSVVTKYALWPYVIIVLAIIGVMYLVRKWKTYKEESKKLKIDKYDFEKIEQVRSLTMKEKKIRAIKDSIEGKLLCFKCGAPMVLRTARSGRYKGKKFYGCSQFPNCRVIINKEEYDKYLKIFD